MRKVKLNMKELHTYNVVKNLVDNNGNKTTAALKLDITIRQVNRLIKIYKEKGKAGFIHGNRGRTPAKALAKSLSEDIVLLYSNKYQGFNFSHFRDYLLEDENINVSYTFIYDTLTKEGILSPKARKRTRKEYKKQQLLKEKRLENKSDEEIEATVNREIALEDSHPRQERPKYFGENIEMDGSIHLWFGDKKTCLHLAADKTTNTIVGAWFDYYETLNGYYIVFHQILTNYGIPYKFTTDNRSVFNYESLNKSKQTSDKDVLTQFGYACKTLGVELKTTSVSQGKPLVERDNGTFQDRLINELRLNGINNMEGANNYLTNVFVPKFNKKFALDFRKFDSVFEVAPTSEKINYTLAILTPRKIDNGNSIKYKNKYYQPYENNKLICFMPKTECLVINAYNGDLLVTVDDKVYELREVKLHKEVSVDFDLIVEGAKVEKKKYIPPMSHPWRLNSFKKQIEKAHTKHIYA